MANTIDLFCWPEKDDLQSFSPHCLAVMAYSQFSKASVRVHNCARLQQYTASLPVAYNNGKMIEGMESVFTFMRSQGWNADYGLSEKQQADTLAFEALVKDKLEPAILHLQFVNAENFSNCVRGYYANACSFPWNFYIPGRLQKRAQLTLSALQPTSNRKSDLPDSSLQKKVITEARHCLSLLSKFLHDKEFLFGDSPRTMDAVLYGYLAFLLKSNLPNNVLCAHIRGCPNLNRFVCHVDDQFMKSVPKASTTDASVIIPRLSLSDDRKAQLKVLASIGIGVTAMLAYALLSGMISITLEDDPDADYVTFSVDNRCDDTQHEETTDNSQQ